MFNCMLSEGWSLLQVYYSHISSKLSYTTFLYNLGGQNKEVNILYAVMDVETDSRTSFSVVYIQEYFPVYCSLSVTFSCHCLYNRQSSTKLYIILYINLLLGDLKLHKISEEPIIFSRSALKILTGTPTGKRPLGTPKR